MGFLFASQGAARKPFFCAANRESGLGCFERSSRGDFAQSGNECFHLLLRADGDAQKIVHRRETPADKNIASRELIDDRLHVGPHVDHDKIGL